MRQDPFSRCHPGVQLLFFLGAIGFGVVFQHPAYLLAGGVCAAGYYLLLHGAKGWRHLSMWLPVFAVLTLVNPLFNPRGEHVLLVVFGRPYTWEALLYGAVIAGAIPALSLLLVLVFRLIPRFFRQIRQISGARRSVGKGAGDRYRDKVTDGLTVLSAMTSWALEGSLVTAASMRSRGYGAGRRSSFQVYRMTGQDGMLLGWMLLLGGVVLASAALGGVTAVFVPSLNLAPVSGVYALGFGAYWGYLLIPTLLHLREALQWRILKFKI